MRFGKGGVEGEEFLDIKWWDEWKVVLFFHILFFTNTP
jgi:hypothetical protein